MGKKGDFAACTKYPKKVIEELWAYANDKKKQGSVEIPNLMDLDLENIGYGDSEEELHNYRDFITPSSVKKWKNALKKGPMDLFFRKIETAIEK